MEEIAAAKKAIFKYCSDCSCKDPKYNGISCSKECHESDWKGDKTCDDENNHCGCDWDGGDCCGTTKDYDFGYCTKCKCLDPKVKTKCENQHLKGDKHCDPQNNHVDCEFDGGDCCGPKLTGEKARIKYHFCTVKQILPKGDCTCKDPKFNLQNCASKCLSDKWKGDGNCDDPNNTCGCNWDGGDCCGKGKNLSYCTKCKCLDPKFTK